MEWDDELEELVLALGDYSDDILGLALTGALREALTRAQPAAPGSLSHEVSGGRASVVPPGVFEEALKVELRRLLQAH